jgi:DNA-binding NtrC family response regulator
MASNFNRAQWTPLRTELTSKQPPCGHTTCAIQSEHAALNLAGESPIFVATVALIRRMAQCDATVLIVGETGTGKELAARGIHYLGPRCNYPFVPVNCGAIPDNLVESQFFGHERGAFTDARDRQCGLISNAENGTLFLDEIETLSQKAQVALLRFLQDRVYRPIGGRHAVRGNVRIIAASNAPLQTLVANGAFRSDLMYRLAIMNLRMPPLRERPGDAVLLARHFIRGFAKQYATDERHLDPASLSALEGYDWPGNVRELENLVHREFLLAEGSTISLTPVPATGEILSAAAPHSFAEMHYALDFRHARAAVLAEFEKTYISRVLAESGGNVSQAARRAGKERRAFGKLMKKHDIGRNRYCE